MVISDLNIICINQAIPCYFHRDEIRIDIVQMHDGYGKHWKRFKKSRGVWYQIFPTERITHKYDDEFFDLYIAKNDYYAIVYEKYRTVLMDIVDELLSLSPVHELLFLIRLDENGESKKTTEVERDDFELDFIDGKIKFNTIYHIVLQKKNQNRGEN